MLLVLLDGSHPAFADGLKGNDDVGDDAGEVCFNSSESFRDSFSSAVSPVVVFVLGTTSIGRPSSSFEFVSPSPAEC